MDISIKWNICRVCLEEEQNGYIESASGSSGKMKHLFREGEDLALNIYELSGVAMKRNDSKPDKICENCVSTINNSLKFRETCRSSDDYFQSILEKAKSASSLFQPENLSRQVSDNESADDVMETEYANLENQNNVAENNGNKEYASQNVEKNINSGLEKELSQNISKLKEFVEVSEEMEDQMFPQTIENDANEVNLHTYYITQDNAEHSNIRPETSQLQKFYVQIENIVECDNSSNTDVEDVNLISNNKSESFEDREYSVSDDDLKYINDDENQAQVSTSADTNEEIEYYENTSNMSNITIEIDGIGTSLHKNKVVKKSSHSPADERDIIKVKKIVFKSSACAPIQLCVCEICGNKFTNKSLLDIHMKNHLELKSHQCELCLKMFTSASNRHAHMRIHTGERPFKCKYCHWSFNDRSSHIRHERIHTKEKPYECGSCGKTFTLSATMKKHMKVHTNERSYRCEPCGKSFKLLQHLKSHRKSSLHRKRSRI